MAQGTRPALDPEEDGKLLTSHLDFPVVEIGASAGGLAALELLLDHMPADSGMAYVVVLHLAPHHKSSAAEILQRHTRMPVLQVKSRMPVQTNHVYIIPPNQELRLSDGHLELQAPTRKRGPHVAIDLFFRALAQVHTLRAVGMVLSGTGADGAQGLKRIKECGGVMLVQAPQDAEFADMPNAAIASSAVDFVLPVADMPQRLLDLWSNARHIWLPTLAEKIDKVAPPPSAADAQRAEQSLQDVMALLRMRTGHDFRHYKRATVLRRIERRLQVCGVPDLNAYCTYLHAHHKETALLLQDMLISVTNFFRDREAFEALEREVLPALFKDRSPDEPVRAWVAGCATGEEAYSVSMLLREAAGAAGNTAGGPIPIQVFATDIDERALAVARAGLYAASIATDVPPVRLAQHFTRTDGSYRVAKAVREPVLFAAHNVLRDPPFSRLDLICCRNLLIYVGREAQTSILEMFRFALRPGGYLFLGTSESPDAAGNLFTLVDKKHRIYQANPQVQTVRHLPLLSASSAEQRASPMLPGPVPREPGRPGVAELHARAIAQQSPPSLLADHNLHILHLSDGAGRYLQPGRGPLSAELLPSIHPALHIELRTALFQLSQSGEPVQTRSIRFDHAGSACLTCLRVARVPATAPAEPMLLVVFEDSEAPATQDSVDHDGLDRQVITQLESEVGQLKDHLRNTVEHADISTEELKASNEELQAINEELRSATEELETSKEELQSMNQELVTVNYELKCRVEETSKSNDDLQNFLASTDIATLFIDEAMRIKRFTPQVASLFNIIASDIDRPLLDLTHRLEYGEMQADIEAVLRELHTIERPVHSTEGRYYLARMRPYRTNDNKIAGAVLAFVDVTELRQAQENVRVSEERLRLVALTTRDYAIVALDADGLISSWNEGARRAFGYQDAEVLGRHIRLIFTPEDRASGVPEGEMQRAAETGRAEDERWHLRRDGSTFYCSGVMTQLHDSAVPGFVKIACDMTGSKQHETEREALLQRAQQAHTEAREANALKDQFLAVMSHELKHPLNLIQVSAELLIRLPELKGVALAKRASDNIRGAVRSQAKLIDDLLDLSRVRTGKLQLRLETLGVDAVETLVRIAVADAERKGVALHWNCSAPDMQLWCDRVRTEQIVWNLLNNAIKFTPAGGSVTVTLSQNAGFAQLCVADTGIGIAPDSLEHVFGMFAQVQAQGGMPPIHKGGLGIGLALVKELSTAQGGDVLAASEGLGRGATFTVRLPLAMHSGIETGFKVATSPLQGLRVLVVDDMEDALLLFAVVLEHEGAQVDTASSGVAALDLLGVNTYNLLVSDIGMPGMDGYALLTAVRERPDHAQMRTIAMTGYGRAADAERAQREGFDAHITKPVDFEALKKTVAGLGLAPRTAAVPGANTGTGDAPAADAGGPPPGKGSDATGAPDGPAGPAA